VAVARLVQHAHPQGLLGADGGAEELDFLVGRCGALRPWLPSSTWLAEQFARVLARGPTAQQAGHPVGTPVQIAQTESSGRQFARARRRSVCREIEVGLRCAPP